MEQGRAAADALGDDVPLGIGIVEDGTCSFKKKNFELIFVSVL